MQLMSEVCGGLQASALAFTIYTLAKHPDKTEKLVKVRLRCWHHQITSCPFQLTCTVVNLHAHVV